MLFVRRRLSGSTALVAASMLAACNPSTPGGNDQSVAAALPALPATLPLAAGAAQAATAAPPVNALPSAAPIGAVRVARPADRYAYAESARSFSGAIGSAPPDYGFDYDRVRSWAWQGYDNSTEFVEPVAGGYRYYYYRPGADTPYFVRDPAYGYGYDGGQLAVVYAPDGSLLPYDAYGARLDYAARYYARARAMYVASRERHAVIAASWAARQASIDSAEQRWAAQQAAQRDWQAYHDQVADEQQQHWAQELARRRADTARYDAWHEQDFRTPPPPRAIPVAWVAAAWAGNARNYAPPAPGFDGDATARQQAARLEQQHVAASGQRPIQPSVPEAPASQPQPRMTPPPRSLIPASVRAQPMPVRPQPAQPPAQPQQKPAPIGVPRPTLPTPAGRPRPDRRPPEAQPASPPKSIPSPLPHVSHGRPDASRVPVQSHASDSAPREVAPPRADRAAPSAPRELRPEGRPPATLPQQRAPERLGASPPHGQPPHAPAATRRAQPQPRAAPAAREHPAPAARSEQQK